MGIRNLGPVVALQLYRVRFAADVHTADGVRSAVAGRPLCHVQERLTDDGGSEFSGVVDSEAWERLTKLGPA